MLVAINVPQSKTVSIAFNSLKTSIFSLMAVLTANQITRQILKTPCSPSMLSYFTVLKVFFIISIIVDVCAIGYFYFSTQFKKTVYYVFYVFHWIVSLICIIGGLNNFHVDAKCQEAYSLIGTIVGLSILFQVNTIIVMIGHLYFVLKYLHFGSNLIWLIIWYTTHVSKCTHGEILVVAIIHCILSIVSITNLIISRTFGKGSASSKSWRNFTIASLFGLILCYLIMLIGVQNKKLCHASQFFQKLYIRFGLIQLIPPILLLIFVRGQYGDPREAEIQQQQNMFQKLRERQHNDFVQTV